MMTRQATAGEQDQDRPGDPAAPKSERGTQGATGLRAPGGGTGKGPDAPQSISVFTLEELLAAREYMRRHGVSLKEVDVLWAAAGGKNE